ncbi:MAG: hypothetical protein JXB85_14790 [Anaerolineales bacterium]|nr:hypothetical protein [Anaerolineales bacterium]
MKLIDTYVSEVGKDLPKKTRLDIESEIRSILQDMVDERASKTGRPVDDELVLEVLKDYGAPEKVAASYQGEHYLIGPRLYPIFTKVLQIVLTIFGILAILGLGTQLAHAGQTLENILEGVAGVLGSLITALGNVVLIFAIIEWAMRREGLQVKGLEAKAWDPRSLFKISPPNRARIGERITEIVLNFAAIAIFNFYPHFLGLNTYVDGTWTHTPLFTEAFFAFVPWLTLIWGLDIALNIFVFIQGFWKTHTRLVQIGLRLAIITVGVVMLATPGLLAITSGVIASNSPLTGATAALIEAAARQGFVSILIIILLFEALEIGQHVYRMVKN